MTALRVSLGRDAYLVAQGPDGLEIEGTARLRPGYVVEIAGFGDGTAGRRAVVWTWSLRRWGNGGPLYRGFCRWVEASGERSTPAADANGPAREN
jgi:hypothetical protein